MKRITILIALSSIIASFTFKPTEKTWVAIGDSITYLNEHQDETGNRVTKGYMTRLVEKLPNIHYTNQGHNGWTVVRIAESIEKLGLTKADIYSVMLGTNDWWHGGALGTFSDYTKNRNENSLWRISRYHGQTSQSEQRREDYFVHSHAARRLRLHQQCKK